MRWWFPRWTLSVTVFIDLCSFCLNVNSSVYIALYTSTFVLYLYAYVEYGRINIMLLLLLLLLIIIYIHLWHKTIRIHAVVVRTTRYLADSDSVRSRSNHCCFTTWVYTNTNNNCCIFVISIMLFYFCHDILFNVIKIHSVHINRHTINLFIQYIQNDVNT